MANLEIVHYGMGVSLRLQQEWCMFVSSRGVADPKLALRSREGNMPLLQFDRCVFRIQPASAEKGGVLRKSDGSLRCGPVVYGKPVHLVHSYSGLYVTIIRKPAETDSTHFRVALMTLEDAGSACRFRLLPRYKIRSEGDVVHNTDVVFVQQESSQLALHGKVNGDGADDEQTEVTACEKPSALEMNLYDTADMSMDANRRHHTLMAGAATMLFHREKDALLTIPSALEALDDSARKKNAARGKPMAALSLLRSGPGGPVQTPRQAKIVYPFFKTSKQAVANLSVDTLEITCNSLWFFEHIDPTIGGPIGAGMPCRIRHGVTGKYLVAEENPLSKDFDVALRALETGEHFDSAVFELELVASSVHSTEIFSEKSFVVARHQMTGRYVTTVKSGPQSSSLSLTTHLNLEDTLAIVTVPREKQQELTFLIGNVEFLTKYIKKFYAMQAPNSRESVRDVAVSKVIHRASESLTALIRFCTDSADEDPLQREGLPISDHQESMFQVSLHKIAMEVLLCPFVDAGKENKMELPLKGGVLQMEDVLLPDYANVHYVCRLCYRLLKQMSKQSRHAALLIDYVDFMQVQEGYKLHVADTLMEIFTDNPDLPPERCETDIRHFVTLLLKKGRSAGYLKFLSRLCVVNDTGVVENQRLVCNLVLDRHRNEILYTTAIRDGQLMILLPKFVKKSEKKDDKKKKGADESAAKKEKKAKDEKTDKTDQELPVWVSLGQFLEEGDSKMVKFFESSVELLGAVCIGADEECLRLAASCLPIEQLIVAISPTFNASHSLRSSYFTLALHLYLRRMLYNSMRVGNQLFDRNSCGSLVLSKSLHVETEVRAERTLTSVEQELLRQEREYMDTIKQRALEYLQSCRGSLNDAGSTGLVTTVTTIWHTFVSYSEYSKQEALHLVEAVLGVMDSRGDPSFYVKNENTIIVMLAKRNLCHFLLNIVRHETSELADKSVSKLVDGHFDTAVNIVEDGVKYLHEKLFNVPKMLPILIDLLNYHDNELVSAALELIIAISNAGATIAQRVASAEPVKNIAAARAFRCFLAAQAAMQQNLSVSGNIIDEQAAIDIISAITNIDSSKLLKNETAGAAASALASQSSNDSFAGRARGESIIGGKLKAKVSSIMAVARIFSSVREKRHRWRADDPASREVSRLLFRSEIHRPLLACFDAVSAGSKLQVTLLEFFRILSIDKHGARELARHLDRFERCVFNDTTCAEGAAILFNIVRHNKHLAVSVGEDTVTQLVTLLTVRRDPAFAEGLEHVVLGDFPLERTQKQVLNQIIHSKILVDAPLVSREWTSQQLAFNSAIVNIVACCCVDNATCRANVSKALRADDVMRIIISDILPPAHLVPYIKFLTAAYLSVDRESTAQELLMLRKTWTENASWWTLLSTTFFPQLQVPKEGVTSEAVEELIFDGILPAITAYLTHLYDTQVATKARYAVPLADIANKLIAFENQVAETPQNFSAHRIHAVVHALAAVKLHHKALTTTAAETLLRDHAQALTLAAAKATEKDGNAPAVLDRADEFRSKWTPNDETSLASFTRALIGAEGKRIYDTTIDNPALHGLHRKLVHHLFRMDIQNSDAAKGLICALRHTVSCLEDVGETEFRKGQVYLNEIGALRMVTEIISTCPEDVAQEAFNLAIIILEGGNTEVQNALLAHFKSTDERFFHDIRNLVDRAVQQSRNRRARELHGAFYGSEEDRAVAGSSKYVLEVFRFLQLMCEGHHLGLQDYLLTQDDNLRSVNVVKEVLVFTVELVASFDGSQMQLLAQSLALLTEVCQGPCVGNQELLASSNVCGVLNSILTDPEFAITAPYDGERAAQLIQIKRAAVTTLLAVLEGARDETIPLTVLNEVPVASLEGIIDQFIDTAEFKNSALEDLCELLYSTVIVLHTLVQCVSNVHNRDRMAAEAVLAKHEKSIGRLGLIEIERNDQIEKVYFRVPTICALLTEESREALLWSVDRSTQGSKLSDFLDKADEIIYDIEATHRVREQLSSNFLMALFSKVSIKRWDDMSLAIAISINLLFVAVISDANGLLDRQTDWFGVEGLIRILAYGQVLCTLLILIMDSTTNFPLLLYKQTKEIEHPRWHDKVRAILSRKETIYRCIAVFFSLLGMLFNDFFFAVHLLGLISKSSVLKNVVVAVTQNGKSLVLTFMLGCIIVYLFALIGFAVFQEHFEEACGTLSQCVVHVLTTGLRQGGGIGDAMSSVKHGEPLYFARLLYDVLFWAIMIVIFLNILFGIIIDTFAELRDEKSKKEEDMHTKCFICGIDSYTFDRYGQGFEKHVKQEHNMWAYLYFFHHLRRKDKNEYTGQESYVSDMVERGDIGFFPAGKASSLDKSVVDEELGGGDDGGQGDRGLQAASAGQAGANRGGQALTAEGSMSARDRKAEGDGEQVQTDPTILPRILAKLDQLASAQQAPAQQPTTWMAKLQEAGREAGRKARAHSRAGRDDTPSHEQEMSASQGADGPPSPAQQQLAAFAPGRHEDTMSIREHKARMELQQAAADRAKEQAVKELKDTFAVAVRVLVQNTERYAELTAASQECLAEAHFAKSVLLLDATVALQVAAGARIRAAEKECSLVTLELEGLRSQREADRKRHAMLAAGGVDLASAGGSGNTALGSPAYIESLQGLLREGDKYAQLIRAATRERRALAGPPRGTGADIGHPPSNGSSPIRNDGSASQSPQ
jgi:hypothetical protein